MKDLHLLLAGNRAWGSCR